MGRRPITVQAIPGLGVRPPKTEPPSGRRRARVASQPRQAVVRRPPRRPPAPLPRRGTTSTATVGPPDARAAVLKVAPQNRTCATTPRQPLVLQVKVGQPRPGMGSRLEHRPSPHVRPETEAVPHQVTLPARVRPTAAVRVALRPRRAPPFLIAPRRHLEPTPVKPGTHVAPAAARAVVAMASA